MTPTATVLLPVYNGEKYLVESLDSLLAQSYADFEILAINDASTDGSARILEDYARRDRRIRILTQASNRGLIETLTLGVETSQANYIFRHDGDDRAHPDRIAASLAYLRKNPETVILGSSMNRIRADGRLLGTQRFPERDPEIRWQFLFRNPFAHSTVAFHRETARKLGGYAKSAKHAEDYNLWTRMAGVGKLANLTEVYCDYRVHDENITSKNTNEMNAASARIGSAWLQKLLGNSADGEMAALWMRFRERAVLAPEEITKLVGALTELQRTHPDLRDYPADEATADLTWHLLAYFKRQPAVALNITSAGMLARLLPSLQKWPESRWRTS